jgi:hypothetical protein
MSFHRIEYRGGPLDGTVDEHQGRSGRQAIYRTLDGHVLPVATGDRVRSGRSAVRSCYIQSVAEIKDGVTVVIYEYFDGNS